MELVRIGIGGFDNQLGTVAFFLFLSDFGNGIGTLPLQGFFLFRVGYAQSALDCLLPFIAPALDFLQILGKLIFEV